MRLGACESPLMTADTWRMKYFISSLLEQVHYSFVLHRVRPISYTSSRNNIIPVLFFNEQYVSRSAASVFTGH